MTAVHDAYLRNLRTLMQEAVKETQRLDARWNKVNDELNDLLDRRGTTDIVQRTKIKGESLALRDALEGGKWWRDKATYLAAVIQAEMVMREAGL